MKPANPVSEKDRCTALEIWYNPYTDVTEIAQALADARSEGYVAGVEDAAKVAHGSMLFTCNGGQIGPGEPMADAILAALLGPKKEGGG